jgi:hypothetical protein
MKDLFGTEVKSLDNCEQELIDYDKATFRSRLGRLRYLYSIPPLETKLMSLEMSYLFSELKISYVNGGYATTIVVAQSLIEQWLAQMLSDGGYDTDIGERPTLRTILKLVEAHKILHPFIVGKIDKLCRIRNPFVHYRQLGDEESLDQKAFNSGKNHRTIIEKDAKDALALTYEILRVEIRAKSKFEITSR